MSVVDLKPGGARKRRVLVVDDNLDTVHSMAMLIRMYGHEADFAINGFAAIEVARRFKPDVILLDIGLPDMKGDHLARQLRFEPGLENARMYAISANDSDEVRDRCEAAGFQLLVKPLSPAQLEALLQGDEGRSSKAAVLR